jgi:predicted nuclease of predicted toxin-antitoxin system
LRLLLDEHLSPEIARRLRSRGHDVEAVAERPELISLPDRELFARMAFERRAILTNDVPHYLQLFNAALGAGENSYGLLLIDDRSMPRARNTIGLFVRVLEGLLEAHPAEDSLRNQLRWLP